MTRGTYNDANVKSHDFLTGGSWTSAISRTEHNALFLDHNWAATALGPLTDWGHALRFYASMLYADSRAACVYWGPDNIAFYNEKFAETAGGAHPALMGSSFRIIFPTLLDSIGPIFERAASTGQAVAVNDILVFPTRSGYLEESFFNGQFVPIRGDDGAVAGFYNTSYETTAQVLFERRRCVVDQIAAMPPHSVEQTISEFFQALSSNPKDVTMAILYSYDESVTNGGNDLRLLGNLSVPAGHICMPTEGCLASSTTGLISFFRTARNTGKAVVLSSSDNSLAEHAHLFESIHWKGYGEASRDIVIVALTISDTLLGFYVQGTNPRLAFDERSVTDVTRQFESKWIAAMFAEQAKMREQALERAALDSENRLRHMARSAPLGMCQIGPDHRIQWANDQFYQIVGKHDRFTDMATLQSTLAPASRDHVLEDLTAVLHGESRLIRELQLSRTWAPPSTEQQHPEESSAWILSSTFPLVEDGKVKLVMIYYADISHQKFAEGAQARVATAATEARRRQEEFIDTVGQYPA
jgi:PAS domain-containing protein